jgi:adenylate kinase
MRLVLIGPPGSGKGTQAERLAATFGWAYIGTGRMVREAIQQQTPTGQIAEPLIQQGIMVPDLVMNAIVAERLRPVHRPEAFILDGYPRTVPQAAALDALLRQEFLALDCVLNFHLTDRQALDRVLQRRICSSMGCQATYHLTTRPPRVPERCDHCAAGLQIREDDRPEAAARRLAEYQATAEPLLEYYQRQGLIRQVAAGSDEESVFEQILALLQSFSGA